MRGNSKSVSVSAAGGSLLDRKLELKPQYFKRAYYTRQFGIHGVAVAFCGKVYRGAIGTRSVLNDRGEGIWSADKARAWAAQDKHTSIEVHSNWRTEKMTLEQYFSPQQASSELMDYMIRNKIPILVEENTGRNEEPWFEVNPYTLGKIGFAKAIDPYTAFQELSMWIGGVLGGTSPEIVRITDDQVLIANHGFDKHSFRSSVRTA